MFVFFVFAACAEDAEYPHSGFSGIQSGGKGRTCVDEDGDGYGPNCTFGNDCDDADPEVTNHCFRCAHIVQDCPCKPGQPAVSCFLEPTETEDGHILCYEGQRFCREGVWSECKAVRSYLVSESDQTTALVDPDAGVPHCNQCNLNCYRVSDPLDPVDGGVGSETCDNVCWADGGGIRLTTDRETNICHEGEVPPEPPTCIAANPESGTPGSDPDDDDCDGIPNAYDPDPYQRLFDSPHQTIFARLGPGDTASTTLETPLRTPAADIYFLLDQSQTMSDERNTLLATFDSGSACEAHSDCPGLCFQGRCFVSDALCSSDSECSGICADNSCRYLGSTDPCLDVDADGAPIDELKSHGILGSIRCMVGQPRFGAGTFNELPIAPYSASYDESVYQHLADIGEIDDAALLDRISQIESYAAVSSDYPQAQTQALWSIATAGSLYLGIDRFSVPIPSGCSDDGFGYPCFSQTALPVVLMLTDSPFHNGSLGIHDYPSSIPITIDPEVLISGDLLEVPDTNDTVYGAFNPGPLSEEHLGLRGNTGTMTGFLSADHLGCSYDDRVKDAYFKFTVHSEQQLTFSTENSAFDTTISLFRELLVDNTNETVSDAFDIDRQLGTDIRGRRVKLIGDTTDMRSDYPGEVVGAAADNQMNDAVFRFSLEEETTVRIDTEGSEIDMLYAVYDATTPLTDPPLAYGETPTNASPDDEEDCHYFEYDRKGYWFCRAEKSFADALSRCDDSGMSLVAIEDRQENDFIEDHIVDETFIGGYDIEEEWYWGATGEHFWSGRSVGWNGEAVDDRYTNWAIGEPNNSNGEEDCAEIYRSGTWNDIPSTSSRDYVCEAQRMTSNIEITLSPGDYYIVVKGQGTQGGGRYSLTIQDLSAVETFCNNDTGSSQTSEMTATLDPGDYLLVLSGNADGDEGEYQIHIWSQSFIPRTWERAIAALQSRRIRVMTVLSCDPETHPDGGAESCDQAFDDAAQLAIATEAVGAAGRPLVYRIDDSSRIPAGAVAAVQELLQNLTFDVGLRIVPDPDSNPFVSTITPAEDEEPHDCAGITETEFLSCTKTSKPEFALQFTNPEFPDNVPPSAGGHAFKIQILGYDDYVIDEVPAYIVAESESVPQGDPYLAGSYLQDIDSSGCEGTTRPDWHTLQWSADVPSGTQIVFEVCSSETKAGLEECEYRTVATATSIDSTLEVEGGGCEDDNDCSPLKDCGSKCVNNRCIYAGQKVDLGFALGAENNFRKFLRLKAVLNPDNDTRLTTPTLYDYQLDYVCTAAE